MLFWLGALPFGVLVALAFADRRLLPGPLRLAAHDPARPARRGGRRRSCAATSLLQAANRLPLVAGPALGGVLIGLLGAPAVLLIDAGTYVLAFVLLTLFVPQTPRRARGAGRQRAASCSPACATSPATACSAPLTLANAGVELAMQMVFLGLPILAFTEYDEQVEIAAALLAAWGAGALVGMPLAVRRARGGQLGRAARRADLGDAAALGAGAAPAADRARRRAVRLGAREPARQRADDVARHARACRRRCAPRRCSRSSPRRSPPAASA